MATVWTLTTAKPVFAPDSLCSICCWYKTSALNLQPGNAVSIPLSPENLTKPGVFNLTESFQADLSGHAHSFKSGSTQRCRSGVLSACELSSEAQRAAIHRQ